MRIIFNCHIPCSLAHGGMQIQIAQTWAALERLGVAVEPLRWWDEGQTGEVLHHFGALTPHFLRLAQQKGYKVVMSPFLGALGARPAWRRALQRTVLAGLRPLLPQGLRYAMVWDAYRLADMSVAMTAWEASLMANIYGADSSRLCVIPNGVEELFFASPPTSRGPWLVCVATITAIKRLVELAEGAIRAQTPVWFIGRPYSEADAYTQRFLQLVGAHPQVLRYEGPMEGRAELARVYRSARGFVLLSQYESLSLSALEAAACECPLLLSDLPWARTAFSASASYCPVTTSTRRTAECLRGFYDAAPGLKPPPRPLTWLQVGERLKELYESLLQGRAQAGDRRPAAEGAAG